MGRPSPQRMGVPISSNLTPRGGLGAVTGRRGYVTATTTGSWGHGMVTAAGRRGYRTATIRHFPKHLLRKAGEPPRPPLPETIREDHDGYDKYDLDPQVCPTPRGLAPFGSSHTSCSTTLEWTIHIMFSKLSYQSNSVS